LTNKGVIVSHEGDRFLGYARQVLEQTDLLEEQYKKGNNITRRFSVSTQHYSFAVNAFVDVIKKFGENKYKLLGRRYEMEGIKALHPEDLYDYQQVFLDHDIHCYF